MLIEEFEERTGMTVGYYFYHKVIEPMYNSLPEDMTKDQFCELINPEGLDKVQCEYYLNHQEEQF
jgi:hypothetical protein